MINKRSIKHIYNKKIPVILFNKPVDKALEILENSKSSAVVVINESSKPIGIITECDITKQAGHWDENILAPVNEVMSSPLITINEDSDFRDAYIHMSENGFRHLVVVDQNNNLAGMLSECDFLQHLTPEQLLAVKEVHLVMSKEVATIQQEESVSKTIDMMTRNKVSSIVIVSEGKPIGIFTERDTVHLARQGDKALYAPIHEYMSSPVKTINENHSVMNAEHILFNEHIRHLIVIDDDGILSGILSQHDLVKGISGIYIEMLRDTIRKQSDVLYETHNQLEEQSVLNNILNTISDKLIIACDRNNIIQFTNATIFDCLYKKPKKGELLDDTVKCFDNSIAQSILNAEINTSANHNSIVLDQYGNKHFFKTSYAPIFSSEKRLQGFLFMAEDTTIERNAYIDLQKTKEQLEKSEHQFHKIFDSAKDGILVANTETKKFYIGNQAICDMLGYSQDEIKELDITDIHPKESLSFFIENFEKYQRGEKIFSDDLPIVRKDGTIFYAEISTDIVELDGNSYMLGIFHDITERKENKLVLEKQNLLLREREEQLLEAQQIAKFGNWALDINSMQAFWSDEIWHILDIEPGIEIGLEFLSTIVSPDDWPKLHESLLEAVKDGKSHHMEYKIKRPNGEIRWVDCRGIRIDDDEGAPYKLVGTLQDITHKKITELKVAESESLFRAIFEQAAVGVAQIDTITGRFIKANQTYCNILGLTVEELLKTDFITLTHSDDLREYLKNVKRLRAREIDIFSMRKRCYKSDGTIVWINLNISPLHWKDDLLQSQIAIIEDITKEVQNEKQLNQYKHVVSATTDLIAFIDDNYCYITVNEAYIRFHNKTYAEIIGQPIVSIIGEKNFNYVKPILDQALSGVEQTRENLFTLHDGTQRYEEMRLYPYNDNKGNITAFVVNIKDKTEEYNALAQEKKLLNLIESSDNEFYVFDRDTLLFSYVNNGGLNNLQYSLEELQQLHPYDIKYEYTESSFKQIVQPLIDGVKEQLIFETRHLRKDGTTYPVELHLQLLSSLSHHKEFLAVVIDVSERKAIEAKLKEQEELMIVQSRQAAMGEMISMIAHQWRQPLSVVSMATNNLLLDIELEQLNQTDATQEINEINDQVQYMSQTIDDFRNFFQRSRTLEQDKVENMLKDVISIIGPTLESNEIYVDINCDPSIMIQTYRSELTQVLINIISNAKDALKDIVTPRIIIVIVKKIDDEITFSITNNGPHISETILNTIFEPYFTTKETSGGTGLGLYMSKSIIQKHMHGVISVNNTDNGVMFTITIPQILKENDNACKI